MSRGWRTYMPAADRAIYGEAGYGMRQEWGAAPALLVIDVTLGFAGRPDLDPEENLRRYSTFCRTGPAAVPAIATLLEAARAHRRPVFFTTVPPSPKEHVGRWRVKHPRTLESPPDHWKLQPDLKRRREELIVEKGKPSAFFGTALLPLLLERRIDSLVIAGCTTSGCVRATVVDAFSYGFATFVPEDAVFDRAESSHKISLFELNQKYADVVAAKDVVSAFAASPHT